jgi:putative sterol carrier protein
MTYEKIFSEIQKSFKKAKISDFTNEFAFQFNITGEGEGIFYAAYKKGVLSIEPYDYKDNDVIFTADGKTLTAIASGKLEPIDALNDGKLFIDGNREIAKELMLLIDHEKKTAAKSEKSESKPEAKTAEKESPKSAEKPAAAKQEAKPHNKGKNRGNKK